MIISGVKVFISGDYIKCLYQVIISSFYIEESKRATEYYSRMLALWGSWMIPLIEVYRWVTHTVSAVCIIKNVDFDCTCCHLTNRLSSCIGNAPSR